MDQPSLYDDDIVTWAEQQAAAVRSLATRPDLSNVLDWENIAEEIESVGRAHLHAVEGLLAQALAHLLKRISAPRAPASLHWRKEIATFQGAAMSRFENSMRQRIRWDTVWRLAMTMADSGLMAHGDQLLPNLPKSCPIPPDEMLANPFDIDAALLKIAESSKSKQRNR